MKQKGTRERDDEKSSSLLMKKIDSDLFDSKDFSRLNPLWCSWLEMSELHALVDKFQHDVENGIHVQEGWSNSNYGISKLAVIAATKIWARQEHGTVVVNCCCPGYCATSMSSYKGGRPPEEGAKNAVIPATMENPPTGSFFSNFQVAEW